MSFIGAVPGPLREVVVNVTPVAHGPIATPFAGNFTIERILQQRNIDGPYYANDISLYTTAVGRYLAGQPFTMAAARGPLEWLDDYLGTPPDQIATLLVCMRWFQEASGTTAYHQRVDDIYHRQFPDLHASTVTRVNDRLAGVRLDRYTASDAVDFLGTIPNDSFVISYPPTIVGGYEKLYRRIDETFTWDSPDYPVFDRGRRSAYFAAMRDFRYCCVVDRLEPELGSPSGEYEVKPGQLWYVYTNQDLAIRRVAAKQPLLVPGRPLHLGEFSADSTLSVVACKPAELDYLRARFLAKGITPTLAAVPLLLLVDGRIVGAIGLNSTTRLGGGTDVFLHADFPVAPTPYARLAKLVVAAVLSTEVQKIAKQKLGNRAETIKTSVFSDRPASMKYRGLFQRGGKSRGLEGARIYTANLGKWTLEEAYRWWWTKHSNSTS